MTYTWPVDRTCLPDIDDDDSPEDRVKLETAIDTAVLVLWSLTGRAYAIETVTARPCARYPDAGPLLDVDGPFVPLLMDGQWINYSVCSGATCTPDGLGVVELPGPVVSVEAVTVDGTVIAPESYRVEGNYLYRVAGGEWPSQDLSVPAGSPGTWSVTYTRGVPPPPGAASMVGQLAQEFWKVCTGQKCRLPKRWQSITRQGVTITRADPTDILAQGYTGLPEVDTWVRALNPHRHSQPARVMSPDYDTAARFL